MIGEIQFLIKWILSAKKKGHKLYLLKRREEFINNIKIMKNDELNSINYHNKMIGIINNNNLQQLSNQLILNEHKIFNMKKLILNNIGKIHWIKGFKMFYSALLHFSNVLQKQQQRQYLDYDHINKDIDITIDNTETKEKDVDTFVTKYFTKHIDFIQARSFVCKICIFYLFLQV